MYITAPGCDLHGEEVIVAEGGRGHIPAVRMVRDGEGARQVRVHRAYLSHTPPAQ